MKFKIYKTGKQKWEQFNIYNLTDRAAEAPHEILELKKEGHKIEFIKGDNMDKHEFANALQSIIIAWTRIELENTEQDLVAIIKNGGFKQHILWLEKKQ